MNYTPSKLLRLNVYTAFVYLWYYFSFRRGSLISTGIFVYAATSPVNGYFGGSLYARMGGKRWIRQMLVSAFLVPSVVCGTEFCINFIAIYYHASRAIPFGSMVSWCHNASQKEYLIKEPHLIKFIRFFLRLPSLVYACLSSFLWHWWERY